MGETTAIAWTDHTFNPWMGCTKVSPACDHCYAEALGKRTGKVQWGDDAVRVVTSDGYWRNPIKWNAAAEKAGERRRVFCASMADVFEHRPELVEPRARLLDLIDETPALDWQLLTKRPENVCRMLGEDVPFNIWIGTTVEDQEHAEERIPHLLDAPAAVRFLSIEPLLGPIDLRPWLRRISPEAASEFTWDTSKRIGWVIVGGESGAGHRPLDLDAARVIRDECRRWGVPFFFKQVGGRTPAAGGDELDGERIKEFPPGGEWKVSE